MNRRRSKDEPVEWNFFSFPVAFAFALGMFVAVMLYPLGFFIFITSLFFTAFGVAHIISHHFRRKTLDRQRKRDEDNERARRAAAAQTAQAASNEQSRTRRRRRVRRGQRATDS